MPNSLPAYFLKSLKNTVPFENRLCKTLYPAMLCTSELLKVLGSQWKQYDPFTVDNIPMQDYEETDWQQGYVSAHEDCYKGFKFALTHVGIAEHNCIGTCTVFDLYIEATITQYDNQGSETTCFIKKV